MSGRQVTVAVGRTLVAVTDMLTVSTRYRSAVPRNMELDLGTSKNARRHWRRPTAVGRITVNARLYVTSFDK